MGFFWFFFFPQEVLIRLHGTFHSHMSTGGRAVCGSLALSPYKTPSENPQMQWDFCAHEAPPTQPTGVTGQQPLSHPGDPAVGLWGWAQSPPLLSDSQSCPWEGGSAGGEGGSGLGTPPLPPALRGCGWGMQAGVSGVPTRSPSSGGAEGARCPPSHPSTGLAGHGNRAAAFGAAAHPQPSQIPVLQR